MTVEVPDSPAAAAGGEDWAPDGGVRLRRLVQLSGRTAKQIAAELDLKPPSFHAWLDDENPTAIRIGRLRPLADALGLPLCVVLHELDLLSEDDLHAVGLEPAPGALSVYRALERTRPFGHTGRRARGSALA